MLGHCYLAARCRIWSRWQPLSCFHVELQLTGMETCWKRSQRKVEGRETGFGFHHHGHICQRTKGHVCIVTQANCFPLLSSLVMTPLQRAGCSDFICHEYLCVSIVMWHAIHRAVRTGTEAAPLWLGEQYGCCACGSIFLLHSQKRIQDFEMHRWTTLRLDV